MRNTRLSCLESVLENPEIITKRLHLSRLQLNDTAVFFQYHSDPVVSRYQSWEPASIDEVAQFLNDQQLVKFNTPGTWSQFAIRLRESDQLVGDLGVRFPESESRQVEIGFTVAPVHQRRGYGVEAAKGLLEYLLGPLGKHRVFASVDPRNEASIALLRKVGMRQEAHFRESLWVRGAWVDDMIFGILQSEWNE